MRPDGGRKKKLIVAFHFQFSNPAAWKCDACRKSGLEARRRCGFLPGGEGGERVVWTRSGHALSRCPKSYVSAQSLEWLERFSAWKALGGSWDEGLPARQVDAFQVLESELKTEANHVER